jgi:hypothetical protein
MGAFYSVIEVYGPPKSSKKSIMLTRLGLFNGVNRDRAFYSELVKPLPFTDISTDPGYQDFWQVWNCSVFSEHLSKLADKFPDESRELKIWLESFGDQIKIVTISAHEWESGLD